MSTTVASTEASEQIVEQFLKDNSDLNYVNKDIFDECYYRIKTWIDIPVVLPYLMRYHLVTSGDQHYLTNPYTSTVDKSFHLVHVAEKGGRHGYMLLYMCILESAKETRGHVDAIKELDEMAARKVKEQEEAKKKEQEQEEKPGRVSTESGYESRKSSTSQDPDVVEKAISKLEDDFSNIASCLLSELEDQKCDVKYIKNRIAVLPQSINRDVFLSLEKAVNKLASNSGNLDSLFNYLNAKVWNFIDYHLLHFIISQFGSQDLKDKMSLYVYRLHLFQKNTTVYDFIECWPGHDVRPDGYVDFEVKFKPDHPKDFTLDNLNQFRQEIRRKFLPPLSECAMIHYKHRSGCFVVTWILPSHLASMVEDGVSQLQDFNLFENYFVEYLSIKNKVLYQSNENDSLTQGILSRIKQDYSSLLSLAEPFLDADEDFIASATPASIHSNLPITELASQTQGGSGSSSTSSSSRSNSPPNEIDEEEEQHHVYARSLSSSRVDPVELSERLALVRMESSDSLINVSFEKRPKRDKKHDKGRYPSISINNHNTVVEVCHQMATNWMLYRVGGVEDKQVVWNYPASDVKGKKSHFGSGAYPRISTNDQNMIVEVHRGQYLEKCFYRVGKINLELRKIVWFSPVSFAMMGHYPDVAINNHNYVVVVYRRDVFTNLLYYRVGKLSDMRDGEITWVGSKHKLNVANNFSMDINNDNTVVVAFQTLVHHIHYKVGKIDFLSGMIMWGEPIHIYTGGCTPCVSINNSNHVILTHQNIMRQKLICNVGVAIWERNFGWISWSEKKTESNKNYGKGWFPSVDVNDHGRVVEAHEQFVVVPRGHLYYYVGEIKL